MNYYNEFDPFAAAWLRELIKSKLIPEGDVDERSITEVQPSDLRGYTQCHFFAGIGGWSYALQLAGWPADRPVWTGSCPCQPFSSAGRQKGKTDERHLWPVWFDLIKSVQPATIFGEQVSSAIGHGWLDDVIEDLESVRFNHNRKNMQRMQDPETFDRVSEILWQIKRGRQASLQNLPEGIREEVAQFIQGIQGGSTATAQGQGQGVSPEIQYGEQGEFVGFGMSSEMQEKKYTVRSRSAHRRNSKQNLHGTLRGQRVSVEHDRLRGEAVQHTLSGQDKSERWLSLQQHSDSCLCSQCSDGGLGRGCLQKNNENMDGEVNAAKEPYLTGKTGNKSQAIFAHGWLDDVYQGLEAEGYAVGSAVLPACSVGKPHRRNRVFFVADSECERLSSWSIERSKPPTIIAPQDCGEIIGRKKWGARHGEPELSLVVDGLPAIVGGSVGYGNAIVPQVAAEFIGAFMDVKNP